MVLCSISSLLPSCHPAYLSRSFSKQPPPLRSPLRRRPWRTSCSLEKTAAAERESRAENRAEEEEGGEVGPVLKFEMSDFAICNYVSIGIQGRADEVVFEATVRDSKSPLYNSRVVLRELTSVQAQRRGRRALEVLKKLARRLLMYHSYAMQVHGYVAATSDGESRNFTLVHGVRFSHSVNWTSLGSYRKGVTWSNLPSLSFP